MRVSRRTSRSGWVWRTVRSLPNRQEGTSSGQKDIGVLGGVGAGNPIQRLGFFVSVLPHTCLPCDLIFY